METRWIPGADSGLEAGRGSWPSLEEEVSLGRGEGKGEGRRLPSDLWQIDSRWDRGGRLEGRIPLQASESGPEKGQSRSSLAGDEKEGAGIMKDVKNSLLGTICSKVVVKVKAERR